MAVKFNRIDTNGTIAESKTMTLRTADEIEKSVIAFEIVTIREVVSRYFGEFRMVFSN